MRGVRRAIVAGIAMFGVVAALLISPISSASALTPDGNAYLANINALRTSLGLNTLQLDPELTGLSQSWAEHMAATETLAHPPDITAGVTSPWIKLGDNMAMGSTFELTWRALIDSPVHYRNLTDPEFTHVGIGVAYLADGTQYTHEWFMTLAPPVAPPPAEPVPTPPPPAVPEVTTPPTSPIGIAGVAITRSDVNLAVIPAIHYGEPLDATLYALPDPSGSSSSWGPLIVAAIIVALLLAIGASIFIRSRRRPVG